LKLRAKYSYTFISLILFIVLVLSGTLLFSFKKSFQDINETSSSLMAEELMGQMENRGKAIARLLVENLINPLYFNDMDTIGKLLETVRKQPDVKYIQVFDPHGKLLHDGTPSVKGFGRKLDNENIQAALSSKNGEILTLKNDILGIALPVRLEGHVLGGVLLGLSTNDIHHNINRMDKRLKDVNQAGQEKNILFLCFLTLGLILAGILLSIFLAGRLTRPIREVTEYAGKLGQGLYDVKVQPGRDDEVGDLIQAFNRMGSDLKQSTVSIHELEQQVEIRTREIILANETLTQEIAVRKKVEEELVKHREGLEILINQRTKALQESNEKLKKEMDERKRAENQREKIQFQLKQAQKMEAIGTLAGGVAHDLNNILSGIISYPELMLLELPQNSKFQEPLQNVLASGRKAAAIVHDLLTLARRGVEVREIVNLKDVVDNYLNSPEFRAMISHHPDIEIITEYALGWMGIVGSPVHLSKTVMNLITNAAEAMPSGGEIRVALEKKFMDGPVKGNPELEKGEYVILRVSDNGTGISDMDMEKIFDPFFSRKPMERSGTGLGMAVVWGTVKDHNGHIDVSSSVGKGTNVSIFLPAIQRQDNAAKPAQPVEDYNGRETILVIDDMENQRKIAEAILSRRGYQMVCVESGEQAVEYLKNHSVDLIILDMIMKPGMDGLETYKKILEIHPRQKAIIVSGFSETERIREARRIGAGAYLKKPYLMEELAKAVRNELDREVRSS
jgi:signal transduction histidine kinase/CheY-like chemotaxis protein